MALVISRLVAGAYFLAAGTALYLDPTINTPFSTVLPIDSARTAATLLLLFSGGAVLFGVCMRGAVFWLTLYVCWNGYEQLGNQVGQQELARIWGELALIALLLMLASVQPRPKPVRRRRNAGAARPIRKVAPVVQTVVQEAPRDMPYDDQEDMHDDVGAAFDEPLVQQPPIQQATLDQPSIDQPPIQQRQEAQVAPAQQQVLPPIRSLYAVEAEDLDDGDVIEQNLFADVWDEDTPRLRA